MSPMESPCWNSSLSQSYKLLNKFQMENIHGLSQVLGAKESGALLSDSPSNYTNI